jgi:hypothetical protein
MASNNVDFSPIKKIGMDSPLTPAEVAEWKKCRDDPIYFMKTYCYVMSPGLGSVLFNPRDYQLDMINAVLNNRKTVLNCPRQGGKTQTMALILLHRGIFFKNETIGIGSYRVSAVKEVLDRIRYTLENLPDFLKPAVKEYNKFNMKFENNSSIFGQVASGNLFRGKTLTFAYIDEVAFVEEDVIVEAYDSFSPALDAAGDASTSKLVFTSTPMGSIGFYYRTCVGAMANTNGFVYHKVDHTKIPGRPEEWRQAKIRELGLSKYMTEFEGAFVSSHELLVDSVILESLPPKDPVKVIDHNLHIFTESFKDRNIVIGCDIGLGVGKDYSVIQAIDITEYPFKQVIEYASNNRHQNDFFKDIMRVIRLVVAEGAAEIYFSFESNSLGQGISRLIENNDADYLGKCIILGDVDQHGISKGKYGITTTSKTKKQGLSELKVMVESGRLQINSIQLINELRTFRAQSNGTFKAANSYHDDRIMAMCIVMLMLIQIQSYDDRVYDAINKVDYVDESDEVWGIY